MRGKYRDEVCNVAKEGGDRMGNKGCKSERMLEKEMCGRLTPQVKKAQV